MQMFDYEVRQKKSLVSSARNKKNGSKSKMCSLPSDRLTDKQIREKHGETLTYNLRKPMTWAELKALPLHAQEEYLLGLKNKFNVTATDIGLMLGVVTSTVLKYIKDQNMQIDFPRSRRMSDDDRIIWNKFLNKSDEAIKETLTDDSPDNQEKEEVSVCPDIISDIKTSIMSMSNLNLKFDGVIDVNGIANTLKAVLGNTISGSISIIYSSQENALA